MRRATFFVLLIALWPVSAHAQSVKSVLESFGLMNSTWATNCSRPASDDNFHIHFRMERNGEATMVSRWGRADDVSVRVIRIARRLSNSDLLVALTRSATEKAVEAVVRFDGVKYRSISSIEADGTVLIRDGQFNAGGNTPWMYRCR